MSGPSWDYLETSDDELFRVLGGLGFLFSSVCAKRACVGATSRPQAHDLEAIVRGSGDWCFFRFNTLGARSATFIQKTIRFSAPEPTGGPLQDVKIKVSKGPVFLSCWLKKRQKLH